jgi:hypothetical protein
MKSFIFLCLIHFLHKFAQIHTKIMIQMVSRPQIYVQSVCSFTQRYPPYRSIVENNIVQLQQRGMMYNIETKSTSQHITFSHLSFTFLLVICPVAVDSELGGGVSECTCIIYADLLQVQKIIYFTLVLYLLIFLYLYYCIETY